MTQEELNNLLNLHKKWLNGEEKGVKLNLSNADLSNADLRYADLRYANLFNANLSNANLSNADLRDADLSNANLFNANLFNANLSNANLSNADLRDADLSNADLRYADLINADLRYANLSNADLRYADFEYSILSNAKLDEKEKFRVGVILTETLQGFKKCFNGVIVELEIPVGAIVYCINGSKCRTNKAKVLSISEGDVAHSIYNDNFTYSAGQEIEIEDFDLAYNAECGTGIHFFKTREEAENYGK